MLENNVRYYAWRIIKVDLSKYGDAEKVIIKAFERNEFEKNGVRETCRRLAGKHGYAASGLRKTYTNMKKYGAFEMLFPERFVEKIKVVTLKMKESNAKKIDELVAQANSETSLVVKKQDVINKIVETAYEVMKKK